MSKVVKKKVGKHWMLFDEKGKFVGLPEPRKRKAKKVDNRGKQIGTMNGMPVFAISDPKGLY